MNNEETPRSEENKAPQGLDNWNNRLDQNLENEDQGNTDADFRAARFSETEGSGDQSDENGSASPDPEHQYEDNMARNHPHSKNPDDQLDREE